MTDPVVAGSTPQAVARNPARFFLAAWLITVLALVGSVWTAFDSYQQYSTTTQYVFEAQRLRGAIVHLDEVLTKE